VSRDQLPESPVARAGTQFVENDRPDLAALVPAGAHDVLDVGCGPGYLGAELKRRGVARVVGIELNPAAAKLASERLDEILVCDIETEELPYADGSFDCLVYGDILEHLIDPWALLRAHRRLVREDGKIIVSMPNIGYWGVIRELLRGRWEYTTFGTMDATHLRFGTLQTIKGMCEQGGFRIAEVHTSVPRNSKAGIFNRLTRRRLEHLLVWRYIVEARPS
jgi:2-polyprenyl-3-methyl-5-hydroxy-6-metoxy-1,4-benzoquinol methylase